MDELGGDEFILDMEVDLIAVDGLKHYGSCVDKVALLTFDQYREHRDIITNKPSWWYLVTPFSTKENGYSSFAWNVYSDGTAYIDDPSNSDGVAPAFVLKSTAEVVRSRTKDKEEHHRFMELTITNIIVIALFIEAIIEAVKPIWNKEAKRLSLPELLSMAAGIVVAVLGRVNMLDGLITTETPALLYVLYIFSGVALGRGPSFVHDLRNRIKTFNADTATEAAQNAETLKNIILRIFTTSGTSPEVSEASVDKTE